MSVTATLKDAYNLIRDSLAGEEGRFEPPLPMPECRSVALPNPSTDEIERLRSRIKGVETLVPPLLNKAGADLGTTIDRLDAVVADLKARAATEAELRARIDRLESVHETAVKEIADLQTNAEVRREVERVVLGPTASRKRTKVVVKGGPKGLTEPLGTLGHITDVSYGSYGLVSLGHFEAIDNVLLSFSSANVKVREAAVIVIRNFADGQCNTEQRLTASRELKKLFAPHSVGIHDSDSDITLRAFTPRELPE